VRNSRESKWIQLEGNAEICGENGISYTHNLDPCDFVLFSKLKVELKGQRFDNKHNFSKYIMRELGIIPKEEFQTCS
jgi:hypothetical protein